MDADRGRWLMPPAFAALGGFPGGRLGRWLRHATGEGYAPPLPRPESASLWAVPELPDIFVYCECLAARIGGATLVRSRIVSPNLLRTAEPDVASPQGRTV